MDDRQKIALLRQWILAAKRAVFFGGAGVSTESGVPDFRSKDGLYNRRDVQFDRYPPEYLLSHTCLEREPAVFYEFYRQKMDARQVQPNAAHRFLAQWEQQGGLQAVVTQNIDGLHQAAGSKRVFEIHGSTRRNYCTACGKTFGPDAIFDSPEPIPRCSCGGSIRCDVTLYEESLPQAAVEGAVAAIRQADLMIIGGTSLTVYPAASYVGYFHGEHLVVINKDPLNLPLRSQQDMQLNLPIGRVFAEFL